MSTMRAAFVAAAVACGAALSGCSLLFDVRDFDSGGGTCLDFQTRCADPGVIRCVGLDSSAELSAIYPGSTSPCAGVDADVHASGDGALEMTISKSASDGVDACAFNFGPGTTTVPPANTNVLVGKGETFYVQWRQRIDAATLGTDYGATGFLQGYVGSGDSGGKAGEYTDGVAVALNASYGSAVPQLFVGGVQAAPIFGTDDYLIQNAVPGCTYHAPAGCRHLRPDQWMTFEVAIVVGDNDTPNTHVVAWLGYEGELLARIVDVDWTLNPGNPTAPPPAYGKVWLWPDLPGRTNAASVEGHVWYDELVVSRAPIASPCP